MSGVNSTLILRPTGLTAITFDMSASTGATSGYVVDAGSLRLNEEERLDIVYAEGAKMDGGRVASSRGPLVELSFAVILSDTSRAAMIQRAHTLIKAVNNDDGGTLQYKPDGVGAGVRSTYYHYLKSKPPALRAAPGNRWDGPVPDDGVYRVVMEVELMTLPFATSDPDNPVQVLTVTTLNNIDDGTNDYVTITAATVEGSMPALVRFIAHPLTAGAAAAVGRFWLAQRIEGLDNFAATYLTSAAVVPTAVWSTETDAARCGGSYYRCTPAASNIVYARRYTIANWSDHKGRAAIMVVVRNNGGMASDFDIYYRWTIANYALTGDSKNTASARLWEPLILGEVTLPETDMSDIEDLDLYIDICVVRTSGSGTFDLDCLKLLYTDVGVIQADMPSGYGASSTHSLLLENLNDPDDIGHAIVHASSKLAYILNVFGTYVKLSSVNDNRLDVAWERYLPAVFEDSFDGYSGRWAKIADFETDELWLRSPSENEQTKNTALAREGSSCILVENDIYYDPATPLDLSAFSEDDFITCLWYGTFTTGAVYLRLYSSATDYYRYTLTCILGEWEEELKLSTGVAYGSPTLTAITRIFLDKDFCQGYIDDLRMVTADPDDAATFNDTGDVWDTPSGTWHVYELDGEAKAFGQAETDGASVEKTALIHVNYGADVIYRAKVRAKRDEGVVGIVFRCTDGTSGSEDCYAFLLDTTNDELLLRSYAAGVPSNVAAAVAFTSVIDTDYYLGVIVRGSSIEAFAATTVAALWETANRKFNETDGTHTTGQCGLMSIDTLGRFTDVRLDAIQDIHVPADQIQLSAWALFRTIAPFAE